jgi:hypothetical protein
MNLNISGIVDGMSINRYPWPIIRKSVWTIMSGMDSTMGEYRDSKLTLLPGEAMWKGLIFDKISALSMPHLLEYMNESIKMNNVTSGTIESSL